LRVLPLVSAITVGLAFVVPSFLMFEPSNSGEKISLKLGVIIVIAAFGFAAAFYRVLGSWWRTHRLVADWSQRATPLTVGNVSIPTYKLVHDFPIFAVVGVIRPRLFIAEQVLTALDENEVAAVVEHELGHISAMDNLKRLTMQLCSDVLVAPIGRPLDKAWSEASEAAADEFAAGRGDRSRALDLAAALIKIARIIPDVPVPKMPAVSFAHEFIGESLTARVRRLLQLAEQDNLENRPTISAAIPALLFVSWFVVILATDGAFLARVHNLSEIVLSTLQ